MSTPGVWRKCVDDFLDKYTGKNRQLWEEALKQSEDVRKKSGITDEQMDEMIESFPGVLARQINVEQILLSTAGSGSAHDAWIKTNQ